MRKLIPFLFIAIVGCAKEWTEDERRDVYFTWGLSDYAAAAFEGTSGALAGGLAGLFGTCMRNKVVERWSYDDWVANQDAYMTQMIDDGSAEECKNLAIDTLSPSE